MNISRFFRPEAAAEAEAELSDPPTTGELETLLTPNKLGIPPGVEIPLATEFV